MVPTKFCSIAADDAGQIGHGRLERADHIAENVILRRQRGEHAHIGGRSARSSRAGRP